MSDSPWLGDAVSLVDAYRCGERSPTEELEATIAAIGASSLNAITHSPFDEARVQIGRADVSLPFGGVPIAVKELDPVKGWPYNEASLAFADRVAEYDSTMVTRLRERGGAVTAAQTTASEFGGLNISISKLHGVTHNPWKRGHTTGGSSAGSAAAVAGGLCTIATGGDGGGSIRIPAGFCGLVGMKGTAGRIPRGPRTLIAPLTVVTGCMARSVRDVCRWYDVTTGPDARDPYSLPRIDGWERDLGSRDLRGLRVAIAPTLGNAVVRDEVQERVIAAGEALAADAGLTIVDAAVTLPPLDLTWAMGNLAGLKLELGDRWPACKDDLTAEIAFGLSMAEAMMNLDMVASGEGARIAANEAMAAIFDQVDLVICATNPDVAFPADVYLNTRVGTAHVEPGNNGALTIPANISGNPAISVPVESFEGLPIGMQIIGRHHADALLLDLAHVVERQRPWPLVAPRAPV
jgi:Asp-tRNA(Asn)/Glu-tRNA(Gln) amidotransferase A subunit family amidase